MLSRKQIYVARKNIKGKRKMRLDGELESSSGPKIIISLNDIQDFRGNFTLNKFKRHLPGLLQAHTDIVPFAVAQIV